MEKDGKRAQVSKRVRLSDIARRCEVSVATVSRALGSEHGVTPVLRRRILDVARELNYALPSSMAGKRVMLVASTAAMVDYARNQFTLHVLEGLRARAVALRMEVLTRTVDGAADERAVLCEAAADAGLAGLLFLTLDDEAMLAPTRAFAKPVVLINGDDPEMRLSSVSPCNRSAAALATGYLRGLGHRRILFLHRPGRRTIARRVDGWRDAMGADADPALVETVEDWLPELAQAAIAQRIAARGRDFTAVLAAGDVLASGALMALKAAGLRVPEEVSVMGIDGLPQGMLQSPPLSTIEIPMRALGAVGLDLLREAVTGYDLPVRRVELACALRVRASTVQALCVREGSFA